MDPSPDRPASAEPRTNWVSTGLLTLLMVGTSWAVASCVSEWLVLPYLILMTLLLSPSTGRHQGDSASEGSDASESLPSASPVGGSDDPDPSSEASDSPEFPGEGSEQGHSPKPARARRGKGRARKAKAIPEPSEATWIQVAPGKFVRAESADESQGQAGPHSRVGVPVEVPSTPQRLELEEGETLDQDEGRAEVEEPPGDSADVQPESLIEESSPLDAPTENAEPAFEPFESPEGDPTGAVESAALTIDIEGSERARSPEVFEETSAADGNAPRAGGSLEDLEATTPDAPPEVAVEDETWVEPLEGSESEGDPLPWAVDPEPESPEVLADVPPEEMDEPGATLEGTDPTETAVDETVLDDAGPFAVAPDPIESPEGPDASATIPLPGRSDGPSCWPWRLSTGARFRVGHAPPRSIGRTPPPGRPPRLRRGARRPLDPRRFDRRGDARPRQVNRTFPPRSPPSGGCRPGSSCKIYRDFMICERHFGAGMR